MQLQFAILADSAFVLPDGKFVIVGGGIEALNAPAFPVMNPALTLFARVAVSADDLDRQHMIHLDLLSPDGINLFAGSEDKPLIPEQRAGFPVDTPPSYTLVINLPGLIFPAEGKYLFRLTIDGQQLGGEIPLYLLKSPSEKEPERTEA